MIDTLKTPTTWSHVEVSVALISACLPTMRPLLTAFLRAIGAHDSNRDRDTDRTASKPKPMKRVSIHNTPSTGLSQFSILEKGRDGSRTSFDHIPLNSIQVQKGYEQTVAIDDQEMKSMDERLHKNWYPGHK